jgi:hypothetical protein
MSVFFPIHAILLFVHEQCEKKKETGKKSAWTRKEKKRKNFIGHLNNAMNSENTQIF